MLSAVVVGALEARINAVKAKEKDQQRKLDTRRKILLGAYILDKQGEGVDWQAWLKKLDPFLERDNDRKLFGLPSREAIRNTQAEKAYEENEA